MTAVFSKASISPRMRQIKQVLWAILVLNLVVAAAKYFYGTMSGSAAMQADGIHSVFDSAGNVVGLVGITLAARPADESHPYGHAKFETYASLVIGVLLLVAALSVGSNAVHALMTQSYGATVTPISFLVMIGTLCVNLGVTRYEHKQGKLLKSPVLIADASHTLSDAMVSVGVIVGLILVSFGIPIADPLMALLVTLAILYTAYDVFRHGFATLSDRARIPEEEIRSCVQSIPEVRSSHKIRTRGTEGEVYVDLHVLVQPDMSVREAHALSEVVEDAVKKRFDDVCEVLVHIEPDDGHIDQ
ncbi:MAG: cation diffusion facilitator family transporter [Raoultibacter sp.]